MSTAAETEFKYLKQQIDNLKRLLQCRNCFECGHWIEDTVQPKCKKFNTRPPTQVIVNGCDYFEAKIPF